MDPWSPSQTSYTETVERARAAEHDRDRKRRGELVQTIQRGHHADAASIADLILSLEKRIARLEGESYARTLS